MAGTDATGARKGVLDERTVRVPFATLLHATPSWGDGGCLGDVVADLVRDGMERSLVVSDHTDEGYELRLVRMDGGRPSVTLAPARVAAYSSASTWSTCAVSVAGDKAAAIETFLAFNA